MGTKCVVISGSLASINGSLGGIYSLILACDFQNIMLFLLYIYNVTSNILQTLTSNFWNIMEALILGLEVEKSEI
jgi:hypothetical protein